MKKAGGSVALKKTEHSNKRTAGMLRNVLDKAIYFFQFLYNLILIAVYVALQIVERFQILGLYQSIQFDEDDSAKQHE